ncbi:hypothetical protein J2W49_001889 [Hydrogenophaga palleronii]|uniref:Uncharacterized protein n=1 Tax=Hydrogenophaga palleronii TaxID=65655 RepID=A0ABU1WLL3_9BURK|nr:hypothetical protein [Hydrogenophaga palleronii]MDR7149934.1 hypothetical protein [Hydrogenophaga palleronii]
MTSTSVNEMEANLMPVTFHPSADRSSLLLKPHTILYPPVPRGSGWVAEDIAHELNTDVDTVWKPMHGMLDCSDSLLTMRYFGMQSLQLRLGQLMQGRSMLLSPEINLFLKGRFDHVYVTTDSYHRFAGGKGQVLGDPQSQPLYFDVPGRRLVVDVSRSFVAKSSQVTAGAIQGLIALAESPSLKGHVERLWVSLEPACSPELVEQAVGALQETARCITRHVLREPDLQLIPSAQRLAEEVGSRRIAQALLTSSAEETHATVEAFAALWRQRPSATLTD